MVSRLEGGAFARNHSLLPGISLPPAHVNSCQDFLEAGGLQGQELETILVNVVKPRLY